MIEHDIHQVFNAENAVERACESLVRFKGDGDVHIVGAKEGCRLEAKTFLRADEKVARSIRQLSSTAGANIVSISG